LELEPPLFWSDNFPPILDKAITLGLFKISDKQNMEIICRLPYLVTGEIIVSPGRGTFGGLLTDDFSPVNDIQVRVALEQIAIQFGQCQELVITFPPNYFMDGYFIDQINSFRVYAKDTVSNLNQHIPINKWELKNVSHGNRKKIRQFSESNGIVRVALPHEWSKAYQILSENRAARGVALSLSDEEFSKNLLKYSNIYQVLVGTVNNEIVAVAYLVNISGNNLYVLYWGESREYRNLSPVASLAHQIIQICRDKKIENLDLGISSLMGIVDEGLKRFKSNLGAESSLKMTLKIPLQQFR
jgi:hypothetical protein